MTPAKKREMQGAVNGFWERIERIAIGDSRSILTQLNTP